MNESGGATSSREVGRGEGEALEGAVDIGEDGTYDGEQDWREGGMSDVDVSESDSVGVGGMLLDADEVRGGRG